MRPSDLQITDLYVTLNGNGFLSVPVGNADVYITDCNCSRAVSINQAGIATLYRWTGTEWQVVR